MNASELRVAGFERVPHRIIEWMTLQHLYIFALPPLRSRFVTLTDPELADHLDRIRRDGYTVVVDTIEPDLVIELRDAIRRLEDELLIQPKATAAEGIATKRMYNLLAKGAVFQAMPTHPNVLPIVEGLLDRECLLSGMTAIDIGPGEIDQPPHGDDIVMSRHLQRPHAAMMATSMWALTDFTAANGGTRFVPGSHLWSKFPRRATDWSGIDNVQYLEMPAGSVMIFHGSLWHGGGANNTPSEWRCGVNVQYCPGFVRQQQNPYFGIPVETAATFSDRLLELLGYRLYKSIMGHVDGKSPGEVVFGDRMAQTAYKYD